tara:strand:+ start:85 stop:1302 length:1218 start_codon:yes stop_codon:yes gene_type:complete
VIKKKITYQNNFQAKKINFSFKNNLGKNFNKILKNEIKKLNLSNSPLSSLSKNFKYNFEFKEINRFKRLKTIIVIGMGGSILGAQAIHQFLKDKIKKDFIFFDNIDEEKLLSFVKNNKFKDSLFIIISKSGDTIETLSNAMSLKLFSKKKKNVIFITEKKGSSLYYSSIKNNFKFIEHNNNIGGRFSVFTEVGMVPSYLMGLNIKKIRKNLLIHLQNKNQIFLKNSVINLTNFLLRSDYKNLIFFNYAPKLEKFLYWAQQLIAESLGKKGKGFFPVISNAPKDHHSLLQLYLDGPKDKIFYIFSEENPKGKKIKKGNYDKKLNIFKNKTLNHIKHYQKEAFIKSLEKNKIPFRQFKINKISEENLGELFSYFILETVLIARLIKSNPFNQPAVEQVKIETIKKLS